MSRQIVGQALSGHSRVAESTRRKVQEAARQHGYTSHSNQEARALIARRYGKRVQHDLIAVMTAAGEDGLMRNAPYFTPLFQGIEEEAISRGVDVAIHAMRQNYLPRYIRERRVDGVIALVSTPERNLGLYEDRIPLLTIGNQRDHASSLLTDDYRGIRLTTQHLVDLGHRRIAYLGQTIDNSNARDRLRAYKDTLRANKLAVQETLIETTLMVPTSDAGRSGLQILWNRSRDFTALVCYNDTIAMGAIEYLRSAGLEVPRDISVTGFDDVSPDYQFEPTLTSVSFDRHAMGRRAVSVFYELLETINRNDPDSPLPQHHEVFPVELVARESTRERQS